MSKLVRFFKANPRFSVCEYINKIKIISHSFDIDLSYNDEHNYKKLNKSFVNTDYILSNNLPEDTVICR